MTAHGARAFIVQYRVRGSRRVRKATLGPAAVLSVAEARNVAREWLTRAWRGEDPGARSQSITVAELADLYRARHLPTTKPRSREEDERMLENDVLPALGSRRLDEVGQGDVERLLGRVLARSSKRTPKDPRAVPGGYQANRTRALLSCMFSLPALAVLARQEHATDWVFPSYRRNGPLNDVRKAWEAACEKATITGARPHDLRHRFASSAARAGFSTLDIKPLTGHRNVGTLERYVHAEAELARRAAERVQAMTDAMLEGRAADVVQLAERRG